MDGQRRNSRPVRSARRLAPDVPFGLRAAARGFSVFFLGFAIVHGVVQGGHLNYNGSPWLKLPGKMASMIGLAADDIRVSGLEHHEPGQILQVIGVRPGGSLVGFDAVSARMKLEALDWVASATVQRQFPNQLEITLAERQPFAVWQHNGVYEVIDRQGVVMGGMDPASLQRLPLVSGEGANLAAAEFVNQMEARPDIMNRVFAAARVGHRRWTLYMDNGVKVVLPEHGVEQALADFASLESQQAILSKGVREIDLRVPGEMLVALAVPAGEAEKTQ